ncbi:MAG: methyltransferase domain-containing protein [Armatimonadota bacterium]|nr:MAG: methyltransferase domain-containing protein [Armatimonadota bacterium]
MSWPRQTGLGELLDGDELSEAERIRVLAALRRANVMSCAHPPIIAATSRLLDRTHIESTGRPIRVADIGAGTGDLVRAIASWARRRKLPVEVVGIEMDPVAAGEARRLSTDSPEVVVEQVDFTEFRPCQPFDVITALHLLHHYDDRAAADLLRRMAEMARTGVVVSDLARSRLTYLEAWVLVRLMSRSAPFHHDACVSVARSFTAQELQELARRAGLPNALVKRVPGRRILLTAAGMAG